MDLTDLKKLNEKVFKSRRPEKPKRLDEVLTKVANVLVFRMRNNPTLKQSFLKKMSKPGYSPNLLETYLLKELLK